MAVHLCVRIVSVHWTMLTKTLSLLTSLVTCPPSQRHAFSILVNIISMYIVLAGGAPLFGLSCAPWLSLQNKDQLLFFRVPQPGKLA
jgi:hypothetical protein